MKTLPITGTSKSVTFFEDDTIDTLRQLIGLQINSHPDRMFMEVKGSFPKEYYSTNPKHWSELFLRMSFDGRRITADSMRTYLTQSHVGTGVNPRDISKDEWEDHPEDLRAIYDPSTDFEEWRILGVETVKSTVLPLPPRDVPVQAASIPILQTQSLFESMHPYDVTEIRVTLLPDPVSEITKRIYFPFLKTDTPPNIEGIRQSIEASQTQLKKLMDLNTPKHETTSVVRAKWYVPLISTKFSAPRSRFEQIFYGMTVSPEIPYIGYFTAKTEVIRHKFYVEDPTAKKPILDIPMWKNWTNNTQPQRRLPTLLLYRGTSRTSFDRIAITPKDITIDVRREKGSKETLEEMHVSVFEWMKTLDALIPFIIATDVDISRWQLGDLSVVSTYAKEIREFDMHRFPCLTSIFGFQKDQFRLLRAEHSSDDISPRELQAFQLFAQEDAERTPEFLAQEMNLTIEEAEELFAILQTRAEDFDVEKTLKAYPTLKFSGNEVIIKFVTNLERTLQYADILRFVLTSDSESINEVCPRRMEKVVAKMAVPQQEINVEGEFATDDDFNAMLGFSGEPEEAVETEEGVAQPKSKKVKVGQPTMRTYNYFNNRLQKYDADTFDKSVYPSKCDKPKQVIALTQEDKDRLGPDYDFHDAPPEETLEMNGATIICPPYWCMRDELPLREQPEDGVKKPGHLYMSEDGELRCPICEGKVRTSDNLDTVEFSVIKRDLVAKFPDYMKAISTINKERIPCCYQEPRPEKQLLGVKEDVTYILDETTMNISSLRLSYLSKDLSSRLKISTNYSDTVKKGRLASEKEDVFRVGLGRPSKTLPALLNDKTVILSPKENPENTMRCSFFRTWRDKSHGGNTENEKIINSIDHSFKKGELGFLEELEYTTSFLRCEVIRIDPETMQVMCGFWSPVVSKAAGSAIAVIGASILARVGRRKEKRTVKPEYVVDLLKAPFSTSTLPLLRELHIEACSTNVPKLSDAEQEFIKNRLVYKYVMDPFGRVQAVFAPGKMILPVQPTTLKTAGVDQLGDYSEVKDEELPIGSNVRAFLLTTKHPGFKLSSELQDINGQVVEFELVSGFRIPIKPEEASVTDVPKEVLETVRKFKEHTLIEDAPNAEDLRMAQEISYSSEIYEFLMFALSKDVQDEDYADTRDAIVKKSANLYKVLDKWFKEEAYEDTTKSPVEFVNKVRTPCGQFNNKETCNKSSLCGWHKNSCKIRVKPIVEKGVVLRRMVQTLISNDKQRALVLDARLSPFFSTILYLEMPHELITTTV